MRAALTSDFGFPKYQVCTDRSTPCMVGLSRGLCVGNACDCTAPATPVRQLGAPAAAAPAEEAPAEVPGVLLTRARELRGRAQDV